MILEAVVFMIKWFMLVNFLNKQLPDWTAIHVEDNF